MAYVTRSYKLDPNAAQRVALVNALEQCRQVFNYLNQECINRLRFGKSIPSEFEMNHLITELKGTAPELYNTYAQCFDNVSARISNAYKTVNRKRTDHSGSKKSSKRKDKTDREIDRSETFSDGSNDKIHFLRFRGKGRYSSFTYTQHGFLFKDGKLHLSYIGDLEFCNRQKGTGLAKTCNIRRTHKGDWFADIVYETDVIGKGTVMIERPYSAVGIDLGLKNIATLSDGQVYVNTRKFESMIREVSKLQRRISVMDAVLNNIPTKNTDRIITRLRKECELLSKEELRMRLEKLRTKSDRIFSRFNNIRKGEYNRITCEIVKDHDAIAIEDIDICKLIDRQTTKGMRRSFSGAAWGKFTAMLVQKAECAAVPIITVDPYNTSRRCSHCGNIKPNMPLSRRKYYCIECGHVRDRDLNAALNILIGSGLRTFLYGEPEARSS